ncbi:tyrosine-protein phosphatase non-receptor type 23 [Anopheles moucheti]|uniref:tyrosine-protein phosphatase non-receptor type 23 n=1 Tax=Anopheles moucheti TaxID=186751 RepID=UPI0022F0C8E7|nr:tyrosine-protein phosphatase non-receptor type 23 [Anopheles moucheti]
MGCLIAIHDHLSMGYGSKKTEPAALVLLVVAASVSAIRVDWNTNTGPIVPPTSTPAPVPQPPFRDPAPVWEDQSDDIPNPNPYRYILPPPSRPKYNDITLEQRKQSQQQHHQQPQNGAQPTPLANPTQASTTAAPTGQIIDKPQPNQQPASGVNGVPPAQHSTAHSQPAQQQQHIVPSLAVQYVPNKGLKYYAVVPRHAEVSYGSAKQALLATNDLYHQQQAQSKHDKYDKLNGKYNPKLKKYKAYEKVKYMPYIVYYDATKQQFYYTSVPSNMVINNSL